MATTQGVQTYRGGCQCKAVRWEADLDLSKGSNRCNCTVCTRAAGWGLSIKPAAFRLLSGQDSLGDYSVSDYGHARFCKTCGIRVFGHGNIPELGGEYVSVNLNTLDDPAELTGTKITILDGRHDTWAPIRELVYEGPQVRG